MRVNEDTDWMKRNEYVRDNTKRMKKHRLNGIALTLKYSQLQTGLMNKIHLIFSYISFRNDIIYAVS